MSATPRAERILNLQIVSLLFLSILMVSSGSILIIASDSPSLVIVFWRTFYGALFMAMIGLAKGDLGAMRDPIVTKNKRWFILIGIALCLHFSTWFPSLELTTVAASVVLVDTAPIFTAIFSTILLKETLSKRSWGGVLMTVSGAILLAWTDLFEQGFGALTGDLLALSGAVFLSLYHIGGRRFTHGIPITVYTTIVYSIASLATLILCIVLGYDVFVTDPREIVIFMALGMFPTVLGHSVLNYLLKLVPAYVVSSAVLGEPIGATILAMIFFDQIPSFLTLTGFGVILMGIAIVLKDVSKNEGPVPLSLNHTNRS